ncbi:RNA-directed DNA polymerase [Lujinxingia litoralis]|uniref:RNA-directed DNA polymerase n=1 Tax=Lujinxingia litoralis TaxID=2211119 RepID=A0A328C601_9DELT|nr:reverse transcriptase family protein [Lujinxingia litoralis]RAL22426.1 RNA-directed DNA polymerase [Lujinxingia litoralis]
MSLWQRLRDWLHTDTQPDSTPTPAPDSAPPSSPPSATHNRRFTASLRTHTPAQSLRRTRSARLKRHGLPLWRNDQALAADLDLSTPELYHFACHRLADPHRHYISFNIPRRSGASRAILAPLPRLKALQRRLLALALHRLPVHDAAHAFVPGRSIATNARPHLGKAFVLSLDLKDFFGSLHLGRVRGYLLAMGYGWEVASTLALLCTEAPRQPVQVQGEVRWAPVGSRTLPQGAPTSPALANAIAYRLDRRLNGLARSLNLTYTRYADDLSFSGDDPQVLGSLLRLTHQIVVEEGFELASHKTRVQRQGQRQQVAGVIVNQVLGRSRQERRRLRAAIHRYARAQARGESHPAWRLELEGRLAFLHMLNPAQARALSSGLPDEPPGASAR